MFKVGDRVRLLVEEPDGNPDLQIDSLGTVCAIDDLGFSQVGVSWDDEIHGGHGCNNTCDYGHGWYVDDNEIELLQRRPELAPVSEDDFILMLG